MKIVVADTFLGPLRSEFEAALPPGSQLVWAGDDDALATEVVDAEVLVTGSCSPEVAASAKKLRLVQVIGAGYEKVPIESFAPGTRVANIFGHEDSMAEYALAVTIMLRRGLLRQHDALRRGRWEYPAHDGSMPWMNTLDGAVIGFVGFGHIGSRTWERFRGFGTEGIAVTRRGSVDAPGLRWASTIDGLPRLLEESDVVIVSTPLTPETRGLIGSDELARLGATGLIVNVGRGPIIDEHALYSALRDGLIAGAAIDVWYDYPADDTGYPSKLPFHELPNVLMTPHTSGVTRQTFRSRAVELAANISRLANDEPLHNVVGVSSA